MTDIESPDKERRRLCSGSHPSQMSRCNKGEKSGDLVAHGSNRKEVRGLVRTDGIGGRRFEENTN